MNKVTMICIVVYILMLLTVKGLTFPIHKYTQPINHTKMIKKKILCLYRIHQKKTNHLNISCSSLPRASEYFLPASLQSPSLQHVFPSSLRAGMLLMRSLSFMAQNSFWQELGASTFVRSRERRHKCVLGLGRTYSFKIGWREKKKTWVLRVLWGLGRMNIRLPYPLGIGEKTTRLLHVLWEMGKKNENMCLGLILGKKNENMYLGLIFCLIPVTLDFEGK